MPIWTRNLFPLEGWPVPMVIVLTQFIASFLANFLSYKKLSSIYPYFRLKSFEGSGEIYNRLFKVKAWKEHIPSMGSFDKKALASGRLTDEYLSQYLLEGLRAELCHLFSIVFSLVVLMLSIPRAWFFIISYSALLNLPCIIIQRFNRPRFERLLSREKEGDQVHFLVFWIKEDGKAATGREELRMRRKERRP